MATTNWASDASHSDIGFKIKHLMITSVKGNFSKFDASATTENEDFSTASITFSADVASINTGNTDRDGHLQSPDFFDAASFPKISFKSSSMVKKDEENYTLNGDLTIRDVTKPVSLDVEFGGIVKDPYGQTKAGFTIDGKINRSDFGLTWGALTEAGGVVLSDEVKLVCEVQLIRQA